jgi:hypothetical protein
MSPDDTAADPFGTAALRDSVLTAWRDSPTRFREDANAEDDLRVGGYRDRLLVELAQNAADAAVLAGVTGELWLRVVTTPDGPELRAANTGAPLSVAGVTALASLRASSKRAGQEVGRFGVGFSAVLTVTEAPRVISSSGGVRFDAAGTREALTGHERLAEALAQRSAEVPVLRLVWPAAPDEDAVPDGFTTDVRLPLRTGVDPAELVAKLAAEAVDLLLALPGLHAVVVGDRRWRRTDEPDGIVRVQGPGGTATWLTRRAAGTLTEEQAGELGVEARTRPEWSVCWAVPLADDGAPAPLTEDVLHAPTPTDERLSLPARLFATLPVEPNRRRLLPGPATDAVLDAAADLYIELVRLLPGVRRTALVPLPGFPLSEVDERLRDSVSGRLAGTGWLPAQRSGDEDLAPGGAVCLDVPDAELAELLVDVVPDLLAWQLAESAHAKALAALGVRRLRPADLVAAVSGVDRAPSWWLSLYGALGRLPNPGSALAEELGGLPVPLVGGRTAIGPRDVLLPSSELGELVEGVDVAGLRIADPAVVHPLLERLGARSAGPVDLLLAPAIRDAVDHSLTDANDGVDVSGLTGVVLRLVRAAGIEPGEQRWLSALALRDGKGEPRRADELVLPGAPLLDVLAADALGSDAPLSVLDGDVARDWPAEVLRAVGVLDSFAIVVDDSPIGPDHDLADEADWWSWVGAETDEGPPVTLVGVRDLDLVEPTAWPAALRLLAERPATRRALANPRGYSAWWLARYALVDDRPLREWRLTSADDLAGLYDPVPDLGLAPDFLVGLGVRDKLAVVDADQAADLLDRLGDPDRVVSVGLAFRAHAALAEASLADVFHPSDVDAPDRVRTLAGDVAPAQDALVIDRPWFYALEGSRVVASRSADGPVDGALADLLNVSLASEEITDAPESTGDAVDWADLGAVGLACALLDVAPPDGAVVMHDELVVAGQRVPWWVDGGVLHAEDSPDGLARALAWAIDRWPDRWQLAALIGDPTAVTALS